MRSQVSPCRTPMPLLRRGGQWPRIPLSTAGLIEWIMADNSRLKMDAHAVVELGQQALVLIAARP